MEVHKLTADLLKMLCWRRPGGSQHEEAFIAKYIDGVPGMRRDDFGNRFLVAPDHHGRRPTTLWSCHTDTVHKSEGFQRIAYDPTKKDAFLSAQEDESNCLGADCTVGVWIMLKMIKANVPGLYVFHAMEESGGLGSKHMAANGRDILDGITHAIAFDRRGKKSIITHQLGGRTASNGFAKDIAARLNAFDDSFDYSPDGGGIFTDTVNYASFIPECSNISVGYSSEHSFSETVSLEHAYRLMRAMVSIDLSNLKCDRDPSAINQDDWQKSYRGDGGGGRVRAARYPDCDNLHDFCSLYPYEAASLLASLGITMSELRDYMEAENLAPEDDYMNGERWDDEHFNHRRAS